MSGRRAVAGHDDHAVGPAGYDPGECEDGADNDRDGLFDCDDDGCTGAPVCRGGCNASMSGASPLGASPSWAWVLGLALLMGIVGRKRFMED